MIAELNRLIDLVESDMSSEIDIAALASSVGTTEYHLRRMFSSLTGLALSEYVRRRRMTVAAADAYLHGVAVEPDATGPTDLDTITVDAGTWVVFRNTGPYPTALQETYALSASEWFPSNPWRLRPGPSIVAVLDRDADFSTATTELWMPIERD